MIDWKSVPRILRHCVVAVNGKVGGHDSVIRAIKICRECLEKNGYLYKTNAVKSGALLADIRLTAKGWERNQEHLREGFSGEKKDLVFKSLFEQIEPKLWELDGPGGRQPPKENDPEQSGQQDDVKLEGKGK